MESGFEPREPGSRAYMVQLMCVCVCVCVEVGAGGVAVTCSYCFHCWTVSCPRAATMSVLLTVVFLVPGPTQALEAFLSDGWMDEWMMAGWMDV